jgi:proline iminopeptidase
MAPYSMFMNRRQFFGSSGAAAATSLCANGILSSLLEAQSPAAPKPDDADAAAVRAINPPDAVRVAGIRMIPVVGGKYKVWTKRVGSGRIKLLLLHGGPAATHNYLEVMESFLPEAGIEMYYYDQLGCGNSDIPDDLSLWTLDRYTEEVEEVRRGLDLENFVLYGHSWGGMLAIEYALRYPQRLSGLVISNMTAGMQAYVKRIAAIKSWLPPNKLARLQALEAQQDYDNPEYARIMMQDLYPLMLCRIQPWPEPLTRSFRLLNEKIYEQMQGKSEFLVTGNLKNWERWDRLHEIRTRALTIGATYDEMDPDEIVKMAKVMPNATSFICPNGSHMCMYDNQQAYFRGLIPFLVSL